MYVMDTIPPELERAIKQAVASARRAGVSDPEAFVDDVALKTVRAFDPTRGSLVAFFWSIFWRSLPRRLDQDRRRRTVLTEYDPRQHAEVPQPEPSRKSNTDLRNALATALSLIKKTARDFFLRRILMGYSYKKTLQLPSMRGRVTSYEAIRTEISRAKAVMRKSLSQSLHSHSPAPVSPAKAADLQHARQAAPRQGGPPNQPGASGIPVKRA